jgi:hypothetical protein
MSAMEVNIIRAFAGRALQAFYKHDNEQQAPDTDRMLDKQPQIPTDRPKVCYFLMSDLHVCARGSYLFLLFCYHAIEKCVSAVVNDGQAFSAMLSASSLFTS